MKTTESDKELHKQLWKESGLSKAAYARESGLNENTFYSWFYSEEHMKQKRQNTFVEIVAEKDREEKSEPPRSLSIGITLRNGYNLIVPSGFQSQTLNAVLDVLEGR